MAENLLYVWRHIVEPRFTIIVLILRLFSEHTPAEWKLRANLYVPTCVQSGVPSQFSRKGPYFISVLRICVRCPGRYAAAANCVQSGEIALYCKTSVRAPITRKTLLNRLILQACPGSSGFSRGLPGSLQ